LSYHTNNSYLSHLLERSVTFCHQCGYQLNLGIEKFCPKCGTNLQGLSANTKSATSANISNTSGDVLGTGLTGSGNIIGKEVGYTVQGNVLNIQNIQISSNESRDIIDTLQRMMTVPTQVEQASGTITDKLLKAKLEESETAQQQINTILNDVNSIGKKEGTDIQQIKAGDFQISRNELSLKEIILKGNEYFYKNEYNEAISWYDKAIERDAGNTNARINKGVALNELEKYEEAIKCCDKAIALDAHNSNAYTAKAYALGRLHRFEEAVKYLDRALELNPYDAHAWSLTGGILNDSYFGKFEEAVKYLDRALELNPYDAHAWNNKGYSLGNLYLLGDRSKYDEAIKCYDKAIELKYPRAQHNKNYLIHKKAQTEMNE
jgi:tetratricopeptide (TPR) repeat protein